MPSPELSISWEWLKLSFLSIEAKTMTVNKYAVISRASGQVGKEEIPLALWYHTHFTGQIQHHMTPKESKTLLRILHFQQLMFKQ